MKAALLVLALSFLGAPFQCASDPDPARRMEDTPSEALWNLAERFEAEGQTEARRETLEAIARDYPNSREAARAREALGQGGGSPHAEPVQEPSATP